MPIQLDRASYTYSPGTVHESPALQEVSSTIGDGERVAIIGPTGSGKSTLLQLLNGLLKASSGSVKVDEQDLAAAKTDLTAIRQNVGMVFQYPEHQLFADTVFKDIAFGLKQEKLSPESLQNRIGQAMAQMGLSYEQLAERSPFSLSGGEQRRVAIAGVIAMRPKFLLLDEPTAGLDPQGRRELLQLLQSLQQRQGLGLILVSHDMRDVVALCGRVLVIDRGHIIMDGNLTEVFAQADRLYRLGLEPPPAAALIHSLRQRGAPLSTGVLNLEQAEREILAWLMPSDIIVDNP